MSNLHNILKGMAKMKDIKMIITDLDFTILHTDKSISTYTQDVFKRCADYGIMTAIATARYYIGAEKFIEVLKPDYEITTDGTMTYHNNEFLFGYGFDVATTNSIINEITSLNPSYELTVATDKGVYWNSEYISESPVLHKAVYNDYSMPLIECAYKIVAELPEKEMAERIADKYCCNMITYRGENRYGFIQKNAGKIQAISALAKSLNINMSEIIAFGDDLNDIEMLSHCGHGIAVSNAVDEVKKIADYITESNDDDGVAKFIEKNLFSQYLL